LKGILILGFKENSEVNIDTQYPVNICEFLKVTPKSLAILNDEHMKLKMEPNFLDVIIKKDVSVASFYTGFSFRHYVGKPNFAITVFLSDDYILSRELEGMLRRIAHELLPKREALNFDDILGKYYEMLKTGELSPYWEEIIEGENTIIEADDLSTNKEEMVKDSELEAKKDSEIASAKQISEELSEFVDLKEKNQELESLLEEKKGKIRELTKKYTEIVSNKSEAENEIKSLKNEVQEQNIKLEKWGQQLSDLNENNAKLLEEVKNLRNTLTKKENELKIKNQEIVDFKKKVKAAEDIENQIKSLKQEVGEFKVINLRLTDEVETLNKVNKKLKAEMEKVKDGSRIHIDSITNLKLEIRDLKSKMDSEVKEIDKLNKEILDLKKELKVLRRERDHYKEIIKEKNLL